MENVILVIHLLLALGLIGVVLLQRSEGGGLGMGGGGGGGAISGRAAASALSKLTWILAIAFIITSIIMTIIAAQNAPRPPKICCHPVRMPQTSHHRPVTSPHRPQTRRAQSDRSGTRKPCISSRCAHLRPVLP